ncbi:MAG: hypothetical protein Q8N17_23560, partial [Burkholderiaceae bacterium]|nr:hypothetical protein [Burkholderiaceae bacterium]
SSRGRPLASRPLAITGVTAGLEPLRDSTGAPAFSSGVGVELQPTIKADNNTGINSFFMRFSKKLKVVFY